MKSAPGVERTNQARLWVTAVTFLLLALGGCDRRISVTTSRDRKASFRDYQTYAIDALPVELSEIGRQTLEETLRSSLAARHLKEASSAAADLHVLCAIVSEKKEIPSSGAGRVYVPSNLSRTSGWDGIAQAPATTSITYGSLVIDFVDRKTKRIVFRGTGKGRTSTAEENAASLREIVTRIVGRFPHARR
jgi:hypothetical protein